MTNQETCPHCGAEKEHGYPRYFSCGTSTNCTEHRDIECFRRQTAAQAAEIERLKTASATMAGMVLKEIQDEREACSDIADQLGTFGYDGHKIAKAIRARGEVK